MTHEALRIPPSAASFRDRLAKEAGRVEEDATYASKSHYNDAAFWNRLHLWLGGAATVLAVASGATALTGTVPELAAMVSFLSAGFTAVLTFQKPGERASSHKLAGAGYAEVRRRARQLREIDAFGTAQDDQLRQALDEIGALKDRLDKESPVGSSRAFQDARKGIEQGEASHVVDRREG